MYLSNIPDINPQFSHTSPHPTQMFQCFTLYLLYLFIYHCFQIWRYCVNLFIFALSLDQISEANTFPFCFLKSYHPEYCSRLLILHLRLDKSWLGASKSWRILICCEIKVRNLLVFAGAQSQMGTNWVRLDANSTKSHVWCKRKIKQNDREPYIRRNVWYKVFKEHKWEGDGKHLVWSSNPVR